MKILCAIMLLGISYACSFKVTNKDASISFDKAIHNFGIIQYKKDAVCTFEFSNPKESILLIYDVKTSCGCTIAEWTRKPIRKGEKGQLRIKYEAEFPGVFNKTVKVFYNGEGSPICLGIKGEMDYPEEN